MSKFKILSFYAFINIDDLCKKAAFIKNECEKNKITGLVILAKEGINGTLSGLEKNLHKLMDILTNEIYVCEMNVKESFSKIPAFARIKVKIKKEIVTFGVEDISSYKQTGQYILKDLLIPKLGLLENFQNGGKKIKKK